MSVPYELTGDQLATYRQFARLALPRHTSYPTAPVWRNEYKPAEFQEDLRQLRRRSNPISLYVHLPFCRQLCYYCACTKEIISDVARKKVDPTDELLQGLAFEANRIGDLIEGLPTQQIHLGGGSPTFLHSDQLVRLWEILSSRFPPTSTAEIAVEIDPRVTTADQLTTLRQLGFNRISLGVQDFDERVQKAVNRWQPFELVVAAVEKVRSLQFDSINFDLIYGLPFQTLESMESTIEKVMSLAPDRIAFYRLAMIPEMFRWQNVFKPTDLPSGDLPLELNLLAINRFLGHGYEFIGLDHFAKPTEALAGASRDGTLRRNFQGMTTEKNLDIVALGPSAISQLEGSIAQNIKTSHEWRQRIESSLATERGMRLSLDDRIRQEVLQQLYSFGRVDTAAVERAFDIRFQQYFASEWERLRDLEYQGIVRLNENIEVTEPLGRLLVRIPAAIFDRYLSPLAYKEGLPAGLSSAVG